MPEVKIFLKPNDDGKFIYYAGENLEGRLQLTLQKEIKVKEVAVKMIGKSEWIAGNNEFMGFEKYLDEKLSLYECNENASMETGCYNYDFEFEFPHNLPQSSELYDVDKTNKYNLIFYYCEAILDVPWRLEKIFDQPFILRRRDDLNCFPLLREPIMKSFQKNLYGVFICGQEKLLIAVSLPHSGYIAGQNIPVTINIDNKSSARVKQITIILEEVKVLKYSNLKEVEPINLVENIMFGVEPHSSDQISTILKIPHETRLSELFWSKIIKYKHYIKILASIEGMHFNQEIMIPIVIGTIPFSDHPQPSHKINDDKEIKKHFKKKKSGKWY